MFSFNTIKIDARAKIHDNVTQPPYVTQLIKYALAKIFTITNIVIRTAIGRASGLVMNKVRHIMRGISITTMYIFAWTVEVSQ
jgi:hypothetical protein